MPENRASAPIGAKSTISSPPSATTYHACACHTRPSHVWRTQMTSPSDHIPALGQRRYGPRRIRSPVLPPCRKWPLLQNSLSFGTDHRCLLRGENPVLERNCEMVFVLPSPCPVGCDRDVELPDPRVEAEQRRGARAPGGSRTSPRPVGKGHSSRTRWASSRAFAASCDVRIPSSTACSRSSSSFQCTSPFGSIQRSSCQSDVSKPKRDSASDAWRFTYQPRNDPSSLRMRRIECLRPERRQLEPAGADPRRRSTDHSANGRRRPFARPSGYAMGVPASIHVTSRSGLCSTTTEGSAITTRPLSDVAQQQRFHRP